MNFDNETSSLQDGSGAPGDWNVQFRARQVPGDGNCLFHSISLAYMFHKTKRHIQFQKDSAELREMSSWMRKLAVENLRGKVRRSVRGGGRLYLQAGTSLPNDELVSSAGQQYNISKEKYLESMEVDSTWGGGPEIVSLCNALKLPIHVYELCWVHKRHPKLTGSEVGHGKWGVRRMACFGSPKWDGRGCLEILSCDCRFPDLKGGGRRGVKEGNHFMMLERIR